MISYISKKYLSYFVTVYLGDDDYDEPGPSTATPKNKKLKLPPVPKVCLSLP